mmetsp:Transcript_18224/g.26718  ORF Transcript_18224/g.26718 Transcript_18224/m.26718 type:complete len:86 (+) Transcript_18224:1576-1833(+)
MESILLLLLLRIAAEDNIPFVAVETKAPAIANEVDIVTKWHRSVLENLMCVYFSMPLSFNLTLFFPSTRYQSTPDPLFNQMRELG